MDTAEILREIAAQVATCQACTLYHSRKNAVPGEGSPTSEIMFKAPVFMRMNRGARLWVRRANSLMNC